MTKRADIRAEHKPGRTWQPLPTGWSCHWRAGQPVTLLRQADQWATAITTPWRVYCGSQLVATSQPQTTEKGAP